jgi:hypothetical protein
MTADTPRPSNAADAIRRGNGRYAFGQSLYLVVRGDSALWEYQFRRHDTKKLTSISLGSAVGLAPVTFEQLRPGIASVRHGIATDSGDEERDF